MDCLYQSALEEKWGESKRGGEESKWAPSFFNDILFSTEQRKEEKREKKVSEIEGLDLTLLANSSRGVSTSYWAKPYFKTFILALAKQMEVGSSCLNEDQGEMVLRGIFYCKSPLIEHGVICCFLITLFVSLQSTMLMFSSEIKLSVFFAW